MNSNGSQCNWHLDALSLPDAGDPMAEIEQLKSDAKVIDLSGDRATVQDRLGVTIRRESRLAVYAGVECDLKWTVQGPRGPGDDRNPCYECPLYTEDSANNAMALLCSLGREQNDLLAQLDAFDAARMLDRQLAEVHCAEVAASAELAAALL